MSDIQVKRTEHLQESDSSTMVNGQREPVVWPDHSEDSRLEFLDALREAGAIIPTAAMPATLAAIETAFDAHGDRRTAETLRIIFDRLPGGRRGAELRAALLGAVDGDGQAMADLFGTTRQSWHQRVERLRKAIFRKNVDRTHTCGQ